MDAQDLWELMNESALTCCSFPCAIITLIVVDFLLPIMMIDDDQVCSRDCWDDVPLENLTLVP